MSTGEKKERKKKKPQRVLAFRKMARCEIRVVAVTKKGLQHVPAFMKLQQRVVVVLFLQPRDVT
jgi:hypothetical protein